MIQPIYISKIYTVVISLAVLCIFTTSSFAQIKDTVPKNALFPQSDTSANAIREYYKLAASFLYSTNINSKAVTDTIKMNSAAGSIRPNRTGYFTVNNIFQNAGGNIIQPGFNSLDQYSSYKFTGFTKSSLLAGGAVSKFPVLNGVNSARLTSLGVSPINPGVNNIMEFSNPLEAEQESINQQIINTPAQFIKGINGIGSAKDQMMKMAALRSQMISGSIAKNFNSLGTSRFGTTLTLENNFLYQPVLGSLTGKKYQNIIGVNGSLVAFGIPVNVNISNNQSAFSGVPKATKLPFTPIIF